MSEKNNENSMKNLLCRYSQSKLKIFACGVVVQHMGFKNSNLDKNACISSYVIRFKTLFKPLVFSRKYSNYLYLSFGFLDTVPRIPELIGQNAQVVKPWFQIGKLIKRIPS